MLFSFDIQTIASPLSLACASKSFLLITLLTFVHRDKDPLVYTSFIQEFHEPWGLRAHHSLIIFPTIALLHSFIAHGLCSSSLLLYSIYYLFCFILSPPWVMILLYKVNLLFILYLFHKINKVKFCHIYLFNHYYFRYYYYFIYLFIFKNYIFK